VNKIIKYIHQKKIIIKLYINNFYFFVINLNVIPLERFFSFSLYPIIIYKKWLVVFEPGYIFNNTFLTTRDK